MVSRTTPGSNLWHAIYPHKSFYDTTIETQRKYEASAKEFLEKERSLGR